jgi:uncharacterized protein (DUF1499 family)
MRLSSLLLLVPLVFGCPAGAEAPSGGPMPAPASLRDCDQLMNCVSTQDPPDDARRYLAPLPFDGDVDAAKAKLKALIAGMPRTKLVQDDGNYMHFTFTSLIWRFTDDVEFLFDADAKQIRFRSASRVGKGDLGVNHRRMVAIQQAWGG